MYLLTWPKARPLTDEHGRRWTVSVMPGRLELAVVGDSDAPALEFSDPDELRAFAMQVYAAALEHDQAIQHAAAKASADRRQRRLMAGEVLGDRTRVFRETPEPPIHMEVPA